MYVYGLKLSIASSKLQHIDACKRGRFVIVESSFVQNYESDVLDWLEMNGFNETANSPIEVYQEDDCLYIEP